MKYPIVIAMLFAVTNCFAQEVLPPPQEPWRPVSPEEAALFVESEYQRLDKSYKAREHDVAPDTVRYVWLDRWQLVNKKPTATAEDQRIAALLSIGAVINHSVSTYYADVITSEDERIALIPIEFYRMADNDHERERLLHEWDRMAFDDPYFHAPLTIRETIKDNNGKGRVETRSILVPAPHLGDVGRNLNNFLGCKKVGNHGGWDRAVLPVARVGWMVSQLTGSTDRGKYLRFRGLTVGKTKFGEYLRSRGAPLEVAKQRGVDENAGMLSHVTGDPRMIVLYPGQGTRATDGPSIVFFTLDKKEGNLDPNSDNFQSALNPEADAIEAFVTMPNGGVETTLFAVQRDAHGKRGKIEDALLITEAPPDVVSDHRVPEPHRARLHGFISCARCHGPNEMFIGYRNEYRDTIQSNLKLQADVSKLHGHDKVEENADEIRTKYNARQEAIDNLLGTARGGWDQFCLTSCGIDIDDPKSLKAGAIACNALANVYAAEEYPWVNARQACEEVGIAIPPGDVLGVKTFRNRIQPYAGHIPQGSAAFTARLATTYKTVAGDKLIEKSLEITRNQWRRAFPEVALQAKESVK